MLPLPEIVRDWILSDYSRQELKVAGEYRSLMEAIAKDVCAKHDIKSFDDRLNVLYHVEDIVQELGQ